MSGRNRVSGGEIDERGEKGRLEYDSEDEGKCSGIEWVNGRWRRW